MDWNTEGGDWPHRDASCFVDADGVRWHVQRMGSGPSLLLLHGTGASTHSFRELAPLLARHFDVLVPDLPGHGFTSTPPAAAMSVDGMARGVSALLAALGATPRIVVGHSAGAAVLVRMALDARIDPVALIGLNAALLPLEGLLRFMSPMAKLLAAAPGVPRVVSGYARDARAVQRLIDSTGSRLDDEGSRLYAKLVRDRDHVAGALAMMAAWDLERTWNQMPRLPVAPLLVVGDRDRTVPPQQARRVAAHVPGTEVVSLHGLGHLAHEEAPQDVAALVVEHAAARGALDRSPGVQARTG